MAPVEAVTFGDKNMLTTVESISKSIKDSVPLQDINRYDCLTSYNAVACTRWNSYFILHNIFYSTSCALLRKDSSLVLIQAYLGLLHIYLHEQTE